jgi:hypothetical protein
MRNLVCTIILALVVMFCLCSCSTWHNPRTGETRDSMPVFQECKKPAPEYVVVQSCWHQCMDYYYKRNGTGNAGACDKQCTKPTGGTILVDDWSCNYDRAKAEGWVIK